MRRGEGRACWACCTVGGLPRAESTSCRGERPFTLVQQAGQRLRTRFELVRRVDPERASRGLLKTGEWPRRNSKLCQPSRSIIAALLFCLPHDFEQAVLLHRLADKASSSSSFEMAFLDVRVERL